MVKRLRKVLKIIFQELRVSGEQIARSLHLAFLTDMTAYGIHPKR